MAFVDLILNLAGVLLWLSWRYARFDPIAKPSPASLAWTLKPTEARKWKSWRFLGALLALLFLRAWIYWQVGSALGWTPSLELGAIAVSFRSDFFVRILIYSWLSFAAALAVLYSWLLLLSLVNRRTTETTSLQRLVRLQLGRADGWHWLVKLLLPFLVVALCWFLLSYLLVGLHIVPSIPSTRYRVGQSLIVGCGVYLTWKYLIGVLLALHLVCSYIYFGNHVVWSYISLTGKNLVSPLRWLPLQLGKVSFAPVVGIAAVFLASELVERALALGYKHLPL